MSSPTKRRYRRYHEDSAPSPASPAASPPVKQSWAASGFISSRQEAADILNEHIFMTGVATDLEEPSADTSPLGEGPALHPQSPRPRQVVNPGDVFELADKNLNYFFYVLEVDDEKQTATDKANSVKPWSELLNPVLYERIVTGAAHRSNRRHSQLQNDLSHPERQQFFGKDGKQNFLALIRNSNVEGPTNRRQIADSRSVIEADLARQIFLQGCRERCLPPLPVLINCTSSEFPRLDVSNLSLGRNYVDVIALSLPAMTFLKSLNFSGNVLDSRGAAVLISSVAETFLEELLLDRNRIGKGGMRALAHIVLHTPSKQKASNTTHEKQASTFTLPPITSPSKLQIRSVTCVLRVISVNDNALGDHAVAALLKALSHSPHNQLTELYARGNDVGPASSALLADLIGQKGDHICRLSVLDVSWNSVQTAGAIGIFNAASENGFLKSLYLDFNGIQETAFASLARCCNGKNAVKFISLKNNSLHAEQLHALVSAEQLEKVEVIF